MADDGEDDFSGGDGLRNALNAALLEHSDTPPEPSPQPRQSTEPAQSVQTASPAADRARDETGKFTTKPVEPAKAPAVDQKSGTQQAQTETAATAPAAPRVPASWAKEQHAGFAQLPPATQEYILKREDEMHRALSQRDERINLADRVSRAIQPHQPMLDKLGIRDPAEHLGMMLNVHAMMTRDFPGAMQHLAAQRGYQLQLTPINQPQPGSPAQAPQGQIRTPPPAPAQLPPEVMQTINFLQSQALQQAEQGFVNDGHPHYHAVRDRMDALISSGQVKDLHEAYETAVWLDPNLRETMIAARMQPAAPPQPKVPDQAAVRRAKEAGSASVRGAPAGASVSAPKASLRDEIAAQYGL